MAELIPPTTSRVAEHTDSAVNARIRRQTEANVAYFGKAGSQAIAERLCELDREWDVLERVELEIIISQLRSLEDNIKKLEKQIAENGRQMEGHRNLRSIKGIRYKSAAILLSVIGNVNDLADEEKLASYFGIVPRVSNSNETVHHGRITNTARSLDKQRWCNARWWLSNTATT